jgi:hypothetical protein
MAIGLKGKAVALALAVLLAGCAANRNVTMTYKVDNVTYPNADAFLAETQRQESANLTQILRPTQRLGGTVLIALPSTNSIRNSLASNPLAKGPIIETLTKADDIQVVSDGKAIENGHVFDSVSVVRSDYPGSVDIGNADYKIWLDHYGTLSTTWTLVKRGGQSHPMVLPTGNPARLVFLNSLSVAIVNAAADMGISVAHLPLPATPGTGPVSGTAFFIDARGHMLTNAHVVETCKSITVALGEGDTADAKIAAKDSQNDLALLVATTKIPQYARFSATPPRQGDAVVVYGFPLPGALSTQGNLTTGILSAMVGLRDDSRQYQISAPVQPGNSGGPLFDRNGAVIGIVSSKINALRVAAATGDVPQNVNFAIKANVVSNFLETNGMKFEQASKGKALDIADISERARGFTFMITCTR